MKGKAPDVETGLRFHTGRNSSPGTEGEIRRHILSQVGVCCLSPHQSHFQFLKFATTVTGRLLNPVFIYTEAAQTAKKLCSPGKGYI